MINEYITIIMCREWGMQVFQVSGYVSTKVKNDWWFFWVNQGNENKKINGYINKMPFYPFKKHLFLTFPIIQLSFCNKTLAINKSLNFKIYWSHRAVTISGDRFGNKLLSSRSTNITRLINFLMLVLNELQNIRILHIFFTHFSTFSWTMSTQICFIFKWVYQI